MNWPTRYSLLCSLVAQGLLVLQAMLIARNLGPSGRGQLGLVQLLPPLLAVVAGFGLTQALGAIVPRQTNNGRRLFWTSFRLAVSISLLLSGGAALFYYLHDWPSSELRPLAAAYLLIVPLEVLHSFPREYAISQQKFAQYDLLKLLFAMVSFVGVALLAMWNVMSPSTVVWVLIAGSSLQVMISWRIAHKMVWPPQYGAESGMLLRFGGLCMLSGFAATLQARVFQYIVALRLPLEALGIFIVATTWGGLGTPIWQAIQVRQYPALARAHGQGRGLEAFKRMLLVGVAVCVLVSLGGALVTPWLFPLMLGTGFAEGSRVAWVFAIALPIQALGSYLAFGLRALDRPVQAMAVDYMSAACAVLAVLVFGSFTTSLSVYALAAASGGAVAAAVAIWLAIRWQTDGFRALKLT